MLGFYSVVSSTTSRLKPIISTFPRVLQHHIDHFFITGRSAHHRHPIAASSANAERCAWVIPFKPFLKLSFEVLDRPSGQLLSFIDQQFNLHKSPLLHTEPVTGIIKHLLNDPHQNCLLCLAGVCV